MSSLLLAFAAVSAWQVWAPRDEIKPKTWTEGEVLGIAGSGNAAAWGGWEKSFDKVEPGRWYRFSALFRTEKVGYEHRQVGARIDWLDSRGRRAGQPDYAYDVEPVGDWKRVTITVPAPEKTTSAKVQLFLGNAPDARVWWKDVSLEPARAPEPRKVRIAAVNLRPRQTASREDSVAAFTKTIDATVTSPVDLIVLPEGITVVGTGKKYADVAESLPGPTTKTLADVARKHHAWIAAGLYEREGSAIYNTSVLLDREGRLAGKYRKVYLPREEVEGGITPGSDYPVFNTDFGKLGMMICWDVHFADPARALALKGADVIVMPIWGGNEVLARARAIENKVFIAASGYDYPTQIIDPDGNIIAKHAGDGTVALATLDLNERHMDKWLGDMRQRVRKELRFDIPVRLP
jgi:predicted amidohydrolase